MTEFENLSGHGGRSSATEHILASNFVR